MERIAVFVNNQSELCDFFESERFLFFEREEQGWVKFGETNYAKVITAAPAQTRKSAESLLTFINDADCGIVAGGALSGIPYTVFDRACLKIFIIEKIDDNTFDDIVKDIIHTEETEALRKEALQNARPVETDTEGVFVLDLVALQSEHPEVTSKQAMREFLETTPFVRLCLKCKHIPPWLENDGRYDVQVISCREEPVEAIITLKK